MSEPKLPCLTIPGHPRAALARMMLKAIQASGDTPDEPEPQPTSRPPRPVSSPVQAAYAPGNPTARCNAPDCTLERALALTGKLAIPGAADALLDVMAKRWRDPKDLTRDKWRDYIQRLEPAALANLVTAADARHVKRPANYFSHIASEAVRGGPQAREASRCS